MNKCIRIEFTGAMPKDFLQKKILKIARDCDLEGVAYAGDLASVKIVICGTMEALDDFLDLFHKELAQLEVDDLEIIPFLKDKDYRGVFRVIE